jgi:hypothetical protein
MPTWTLLRLGMMLFPTGIGSRLRKAATSCFDASVASFSSLSRRIISTRSFLDAAVYTLSCANQGMSI